MEDVEPLPVVELEPNGSALLLLEDQGLDRLCEVLLSIDAVVSLFCRGFKVLFGGGKPLPVPVLLLIFGVVVLLRKSANASLLVLERVTGTALKGSCWWLVLVASDFQADDDPKGSVGTSGGNTAAGRPNGSSALVADAVVIGLDLARLLAEKGSKESSKLLLTGTTLLLPKGSDATVVEVMAPQALPVNCLCISGVVDQALPVNCLFTSGVVEDEVLLSVSQVVPPKGSFSLLE